MNSLKQDTSNVILEGIYFLDTERRITHWDNACEQITGFSREEVLGKHCSDNILKHVDSQGQCLCGVETCPVSQCMKRSITKEAEVYFHHKNGYRVFVSVRANPLKDEHGNIIGAVEIFRENYDVAALKKQIGELATLSLLDDLIEVGNRKFGEDRLKKDLQQAQTKNVPFGILKIDVDHFQSIRDVRGRDIADKILKMIAQTLLRNVQPFDCVAHWSSKEFLVILKNVDDKKLKADAEKLRVLVAASDIEHGNERISSTISIGGTCYQKNDTTDMILSRVDQLLHKGKEQGVDHLSFA